MSTKQSEKTRGQRLSETFRKAARLPERTSDEPTPVDKEPEDVARPEAPEGGYGGEEAEEAKKAEEAEMAEKAEEEGVLTWRPSS